jgi:glycosyltransferase involved in cell wall biosynthesis
MTASEETVGASRSPATRPRPELVSVVIPAHNAADDIGVQLQALAEQDYDGRVEVIVADNLSTDGTGARALERGRALGLDIRVVEAAGTAGVSHARNVGCAAARGELIAITDADDLVARGWLSALTETARGYDMAGGSLDATVINPPEVQGWRELPRPDQLPTRFDFLPYAHGCNLAIWRDVWAASDGWDESIRKGCDDIEFAWRLQLAGRTLGVAPGAVVHYRFRDTIRGHARQMHDYHRNSGLLVRRFRPYGLRQSRPIGVVWNVWHLLRAVPGAARSRRSRAVLAGQVANLWARIRTSVEYRVWAL